MEKIVLEASQFHGRIDAIFEESLRFFCDNRFFECESIRVWGAYCADNEYLTIQFGFR